MWQQQRRAVETAEERQARLEQLTVQRQQRMVGETPEERQAHLEQLKSLAATRKGY